MKAYKKGKIPVSGWYWVKGCESPRLLNEGVKAEYSGPLLRPEEKEDNSAEEMASKLRKFMNKSVTPYKEEIEVSNGLIVYRIHQGRKSSFRFLQAGSGEEEALKEINKLRKEMS